ncbi:PIN domain-containing protein [Alkalihalobacillus sp. AL-G]|uniref:PIN domain-containing protein n=1 Tax=Alkalihalobacillus sp. AL-G TaxID=2926399 RepID=UPI00272DC223|nr:PIN domain-containing protein [Alkalihalobacillus sp. AL-G]WLD93083.1 hypothetical protein MOJ78_19135 [Alkalihalobacillus sp. AL-G]
MNIFLDAEIIIEDPYFKNVYHKTLLELAKKDKLKLYVSEMALSEISAKYKNQLDGILKTLNEKKESLQPFIQQDVNDLLLLAEADSYCVQLNGYFNHLVDSKILNIVPYYSNITPELVQNLAKDATVSTRNRSEYKKSIILSSYAQFIKEHHFESSIVITPNEKVYEVIFQTLNDRYRPSFYPSIKQLFKQCEEMHFHKESYEELEFPTIGEKNQYLTNLIRMNFDDVIIKKCQKYLIEQNVKFQSSNDCHIAGVGANDMEVNVYLDTVMVSGYLKLKIMNSVPEASRNRVVPDGQTVDQNLYSEEMFLLMEVIVSFSKELEAESLQIGTIQSI